MDEFIVYLEENLDLAMSIFNEYYEEKAVEEGEDMQDDERFGGEENLDEDPKELYEQYAHAVGHSAHYYGAWGVIEELGVRSGFDVDPDDEEVQWEVLVMLNKEI